MTKKGWLILMRVTAQEPRTMRRKMARGRLRGVLMNFICFWKISRRIQIKITAQKTISIK